MGKSSGFGNEISQELVGKRVAIDFPKARFYTTKSFSNSENGRYITFKVDGGKAVLANWDVIKYITYDESLGTNKIALAYNQSTTGVVEKIEGNWLKLRIYNPIRDLYYYNIVPIKAIDGIKVFGEENVEEFDDEDEHLEHDEGEH